MNNNLHLAPEAAILAYVKRQLGAVIGDPGLLHTDITMDTTFGSDLELESIEFVALADRLRTEFGERVNFVAFLAKKQVDDMVALTVGDVVRYVASCLQEGESVRELQAHG
ncbi:MAG TPA: phosphopantetheine-binding protein [Acidobacteriaceae bacterium]